MQRSVFVSSRRSEKATSQGRFGGFRVEGSGFGVWGVRFGVYGLGFRVYGFTVLLEGFRLSGGLQFFYLSSIRTQHRPQANA